MPVRVERHAEAAAELSGKFPEYAHLIEAWSDRFGGGEDDDPLQPPLVDVIVPRGATQEKVLKDYSSKEGRLVRLPGVVPAQEAAASR